MAITALRQLKGHKAITDTEYESIKAKIQSLYGKWLSPIRTEQDGVLPNIISESDYPRAEEVHDLESIIRGLEIIHEAKQRTALDLLQKCRSGLEPFASVEFKKEIDDFLTEKQYREEIKTINQKLQEEG